MMRVSSNSRSPLQAGHTRIAFSSSSIMPPPPSSRGMTGSAAQFLAEPLQCQLQPFVGVDARLPAQAGPSAADVGLPHPGIVLGQRPEHDLCARAGYPSDPLAQI